MPGRGHRHARACRRSCRPRRPDFVQRVTARDAGRQGRPAAGQRLPGRRHLADRHRAVGEAQHRARDPGLGRRASASSATSARWSARTPPSAPRSTTGRALAGAPATFKSHRRTRAPTSRACKYTIQVAPEDCTGCTLCVDGLPGQGQDATRRHKAIDMDAAAAAARGRARRTTSSSSRCPRPTAPTVAASTSRARSSSQPLFEYSGACAGCGETPYLKLLTQLFGDRAADRQRHRLLVDLRRQPADHALHAPTRDGRGPAWSNSLFEDNAEFGLGLRLALDSAREQAARAAASSSRRQLGDDAGRRAARRPTRTTRPASPRSASASPRCAQTLARRRTRRGAPARAARRLPGAARASGSSAATAGPTTSATAASTTCWRMRPRRQRPGARHRGLLEHRRPGSRRPRRSGAAAKFAAAGKATRRRTSA